MRPLLFAAAFLCFGCAPAPIRFRVLAVTEPDPYLGADRVVVALEHEGDPIPSTERAFEPDAPEWRLDGLPYERDLRLLVEARSGDLVLGRGRSFPFDTIEGAPEAPADVFLGALGRFGRTVDAVPEGAPRAVMAVPGGALWVTGGGDIFRYVAHGADARARIEWVATGPGDAAWLAIEGLGLLAIDGHTASLHGLSGDRIAHVSDGALAAVGARPALAPLADGALAIGGPGSAALTRLRFSEGSLHVTPLPDLPSAGEMRACAFSLTAEETRVVVVGQDGGWVVDPETGDARPLPAPTYPAGAALVPLERGLVAVIGGEVAGAPVDTVTLLVLRVDSEQQLEAQRLYAARRDAAAVLLRDGLALIAGGVGVDGPLATAELLERALGEISPTGVMPQPSATTVATGLDDGTVLVVGEAGVSVYFIPR